MIEHVLSSAYSYVVRINQTQWKQMKRYLPTLPASAPFRDEIGLACTCDPDFRRGEWLQTSLCRWDSIISLVLYHRALFVICFWHRVLGCLTAQDWDIAHTESTQSINSVMNARHKRSLHWWAEVECYSTECYGLYLTSLCVLKFYLKGFGCSQDACLTDSGDLSCHWRSSIGDIYDLPGKQTNS